MFKNFRSTLTLIGAVAFLGAVCVALSMQAPVGDAPAAAARPEMEAVVLAANTLPPEPPGIIEGSVLNETFSNSPVEWRPAGGALSEVTNRWQCDPRWTFFSVGNDLRGSERSAALWSKRFYPGDVTVEFFFAIKMDRMRGTPYQYARDVNLTIGSDGSDLRKGITFSFGGHKNTCSFISRDGVELRRVPIAIPTGMQYHQQWHRFRAERKNGRLTFQVGNFFATTSDAAPEIVVEDAAPLTGNRIAIWTYDNAIMLSKVRISGEGGIETESPDFVPGALRTLYER